MLPCSVAFFHTYLHEVSFLYLTRLHNLSYLHHEKEYKLYANYG